MGRKPQIPDDILIRTYIQGRLENKTDTEIAQLVGMKRSAFANRIRSPHMSSAIEQQKKTEKVTINDKMQGISRESEQIMEITGKLGLSIIKDKLDAGDKEGAFKIGIEALKKVKTEADVRRILTVFVDARQQSLMQVNVIDYGEYVRKIKEKLREEKLI